MNPAFFKQHLFDILDWWEPMVDWENGGIFVYVNDFSREKDSDEKVPLMHLRQLYNFSVGWERGHPAGERVAQHLYDTFDTVFPRRDGELLVEESTRRRPTDAVDGYTNAYAVLCLARYARAAGSAEAAVRALRMYKQLDRDFTDAPLRERGTWWLRETETRKGLYKNDNAMIHRCEGAFNLFRALAETAPDTLPREREYLRSQIADMLHFFDTRISRPDEGYTIERLTDDADPDPDTPYRSQSLAHGFEWMGFCIEIETHCGLELGPLDTRLRTLAANTLKNGLGPTGCFRNNFVPAFRDGVMQADFWPQVEAPLGVLWAAKRWGEADFPIETVERMLAFYRKHMFWKPEFGGGILMMVTENGMPLRIQRGAAFKCDHHAVRMCEKVLEYDLIPEAWAADSPEADV